MSYPGSPDTAAYRRLFFHSLLAFTIAFLASTLIHEGTHAVTARALGVRAVLHHNYVSTSGVAESSDAARLWIPASGPLASLLLAVACLAWVRMRRSTTLAALTLLWLGLKGFIGFFGYLMLGPLVAYGDTGKVYDELNVPQGVRWALAIAGVAALFWIVRSTAPDFERHVIRATPGQDRQRGQLANALIAFPILAGVAVTTLLSLPAPTFISLLHPITSPFCIFFAYGSFRRRTEPLPDGSSHSERISIPLVVVTLVLVAISRALVFGLPMG